jgi:peroxiredoxin
MKALSIANLPRLVLLSFAIWGRIAYAQSADQLLLDTEKNYQTLTGYELSGHAIVAIPDSTWQMNGDFAIIGPRRGPDGGPLRGSEGFIPGYFKPVKTVADSEQKPPRLSFPRELFAGLDRIASAVVKVEHTGSETLQLNGEDTVCDILKVTYTPSTSERPRPEEATYWISSIRHLVLKQVVTFSAGRQNDHALWTIIYDSLKLDRPAPQWLLDGANIPNVTERSEWIGKAAPEFALQASDGSSVTLSSLRGKAVLLDFWSITCGPCILEMPTIEEVGHDYESKGVALLGISFDPTEKSKTWLDRHNRTLRNLTDSDFVASDAFKIHGIPALVLIGADGKVKRYWEGPVSKETIQAALNSITKQ